MNPESPIRHAGALAAVAMAQLAAGAQTPCQGGAPCLAPLESTLVFTAGTGPAVPPWSADLDVPAFDVELGELVRVDVRATAPVLFEFGFENLDPGAPCPGGTFRSDSFLDVGLARRALEVYDLVPLGVLGDFGPLQAFDGLLDFDGSSGTLQSTQADVTADDCYDDPATLELFRSDVAGPTLTFLAQTAQPASSDNSNCGALARLQRIEFGVELEVTYTYCAAVGVGFCAGDGGGVDCPCDNAGDPGRGCANGSFAGGALLYGSGEPSVGADSLALNVIGSTPDAPGVFFQGDALVGGGAGLPFGDGLRCVGGAIRRLQLAVADGGGAASTVAPLAAAGGASPGDLLRYQWWYRDPASSPCGAGFNLSNGLELTWLP